ncbi:MAG: YceH family protein [Phycisphaerales bacterium]|nr:YceH family protein [Phycisphaerales bacterium]MCI0631638.1 YceH family protein [Phycisphaerales bacterium]MCI0676976.1 YceH family protein [Phycisphaerales bacterium]
MLNLTPHECRVLGVLVEKAQTTPQQYPLTLNALVNGANQKNNREPVTNLSEEQVLQALDGLRGKGLAREVMLSGSRVEKFRHVAREVLEVSTSELVILTELLLRGPQTIGELRGRASRMHPLESTEIVKNVLDSLMARAEPMVRELPPAPGDRAARYAQLLSPDLHPIDAAAPASPGKDLSERAAGAGSNLEDRVERLESELAELRQVVQRIARTVGDAQSEVGADVSHQR